jgi:hypothetical protein
MTAETRQLIAKDIRLLRGMLTSMADWARAHPPSDMQRELYRRVAFWRIVLKDAELRMAFGDIGEVEAGLAREIGKTNVSV